MREVPAYHRHCQIGLRRRQWGLMREKVEIRRRLSRNPYLYFVFAFQIFVSAFISLFSGLQMFFFGLQNEHPSPRLQCLSEMKSSGWCQKRAWSLGDLLKEM
ncbi:hypothetical protein L1987_40562 [Smallanthus sonchifolius]|uniref:Uncharacterized protein n=1 Tax=Smallanthus sonchifolius TaxID=185202 RepID=A0ACB9GTY8_9ASTR|nr:hypothetical protein L1987_40562 [Smallanthus sonchifolius]